MAGCAGAGEIFEMSEVHRLFVSQIINRVLCVVICMVR